MELKVFYNVNFQSGSASRAFVRICIVDNEKKFLFGSMTGDVSEKAQRFAMFNYDFVKHISGVNRSATDDIKSLFENITEKEKNCFSNVAFDLGRSFRAYVIEASKKGVNYDYETQKKFYSLIQEIREKISELKSGTCSCGKTEAKYVELTDCSGELLDKIIREVFSAEGEECVVDGKKYCLKEDVETKTKKIYEVVGVPVQEVCDLTEDKPVFEKSIVKTKRMALMKNDKNLVNFNKDELYEIVENDSEFVKLIDIFGEKRFVNNSRVEIIEVEQELVYE